MSKKQAVLGVFAAVLALTLTIFLATSPFMRDVIVPLLTGIAQIAFTIFTSPPDQYLWIILLAVTLPLLFLQLIRHAIKISELPTDGKEEETTLRGSAELYSEWVDEMDQSSFVNAKMRRVVAKMAADATGYDSVGAMLREEEMPPRAADYMSLYTTQQRGTGMMATADALDETLTWLERRLDI